MSKTIWLQRFFFIEIVEYMDQCSKFPYVPSSGDARSIRWLEFLASFKVAGLGKIVLTTFHHSA